jgi:hypothetical protein
MRQLIVTLFCLLLVQACASRYIEECTDANSPNLYSKLINRIGKPICLSGSVNVEPHFVYFETGRVNEESLYGGRVYLPISFNEAIRKNLKTGDIATFSGVLEFRNKTNKCKEMSCAVFALSKSQQ